MWKVYANESQGVAIRSTYDQLTKSFHSHTRHDIHAGLVRYINFAKGRIPKPTIASAHMYKRESFSYEQEVRAIISRFDGIGRNLGFLSTGLARRGARMTGVVEDLGHAAFMELDQDEIAKLPDAARCKVWPVRCPA